MSFLSNFIFVAAFSMPQLDTIPPPPPPPPPYSTTKNVNKSPKDNNTNFIPPPPPNTKLLSGVVDEMPRFPGCEDIDGDSNDKKQCADQKMMNYIYSEVVYPIDARRKNISGTVVISFVITEEGNMTDIVIRRKIGGGCEEEGLRIVQKMAELPEKWTPGKVGNKAVSVRYNLPISFKLKD